MKGCILKGEKRLKGERCRREKGEREKGRWGERKDVNQAHTSPPSSSDFCRMWKPKSRLCLLDRGEA